MTQLIKGLTNEAELIAAVAIVYPTEDWSDETIRDMLYQLIKIGVTNADQFNSRFAFTTDSSKPFEDFVWHYYWDLEDMGDELIALDGLVIDYQATWQTFLVNRYQCFRFKGETHFYKRAHLI